MPPSGSNANPPSHSPGFGAPSCAPLEHQAPCFKDAPRGYLCLHLWYVRCDPLLRQLSRLHSAHCLRCSHVSSNLACVLKHSDASTAASLPMPPSPSRAYGGGLNDSTSGMLQYIYPAYRTIRGLLFAVGETQSQGQKTLILPAGLKQYVLAEHDWTRGFRRKQTLARRAFARLSGEMQTDHTSDTCKDFCGRKGVETSMRRRAGSSAALGGRGGDTIAAGDGDGRAAGAGLDGEAHDP